MWISVNPRDRFCEVIQTAAYNHVASDDFVITFYFHDSPETVALSR